MNAHDASLHREVPNNVESEQALLGAVLVNNAAFDRVAAFLEPKHFYEPIHRKIFEVAGELLKMGKRVDPILIKAFLPSDKIGEMTVAHYVARLAAEAVTIVNARSYGIAIHEMWLRRQLIVVGEDLAAVCYDLPADKDAFAEIAPFEEKIVSLRAMRMDDRENRVGIGRRYLDNMTAALQRGYVRGVPICLGEIETVISEPCFEAGNLYGLLSSSSEGKTSLTLQIIHHALRAGHPVHFQSFDQSPEQCIRQMVAQEFGIEARRQRRGDLGEKEWASAVDFANWIDQQPFEIVKCTNQGAAQLVGFAKAFVKTRSNGKVPLIVTDHIGSIEPEDKRADEGTKAKGINKILKAGAEIVDGAWMVLNQRNTFGMKRDNPRPISADLFGGDPAKQAYDAILYLYRFKKFFEERKAIASSDSDWKKIHKAFPLEVVKGEKDIAELGAIKVRFGNPNLTETVTFEARYTRYVSDRPVVDQEALL